MLSCIWYLKCIFLWHFNYIFTLPMAFYCVLHIRIKSEHDISYMLTSKTELSLFYVVSNVPNWKKCVLIKLLIYIMSQKRKSFFFSNFFLLSFFLLRTAKYDRMRPNNRKLNKAVCLLKSNSHQKSLFFQTHRKLYVQLKVENFKVLSSHQRIFLHIHNLH